MATIAAAMPALKVLAPTDIGDGSDVPCYLRKAPACWHLCGERHHRSIWTVHSMPEFTDPNRPPTLAEVVQRFGRDFRPCRCRRCNTAVLVYAWWGRQAADLIDHIDHS